MVKREYRGPPIDGREQWITERPNMNGIHRDDEGDGNGETVGGTSDDDFFNESTDHIPSYLNRESIPDEELDVIGSALTVSLPYAADQKEGLDGCDVRRILEDHLQPDELDRVKGYDIPPVIPPTELSSKQQKAAEAFKSHPDFPDVSPNQLAREIQEDEDLDDEEKFSKETATRAIHRLYPGLRDFDDLNESTKVGVLIWAYEGLEANQTQLHEKYSVPNRALGDAKRIYPDLIEQKKPVTESQLEEAVDLYHESYARGSGSTTSDTSPTGTIQTRREDKVYPDDFSECQQWFIETIAEHPGDSAIEIADRLPDGKEWSPQNYYNVCQDYPHEIKSLIEESGSIESPDEIHDYLLDRTVGLGEWDIGEKPDAPEMEQPIEFEEEFQAEFEEELEFDLEAELDPTTREWEIFEPKEEVVFISRDLAAQAKEYIERSDEYSSVTQFARAAMRNELNGEYDDSTEPASTDARADMIEAVIELADVEPAKADAIRTLISDE